MPNLQPLIELDTVYKIYGQHETEVRALNGVSLSVHEGEFTSVMGASGSGKSTCMNILGALDKPTSGQYRFKGVNIASLSNDQQSMFRRLHLGFVFQGFNLLSRTSAVENVELPLLYRGLAQNPRRQKALQALSLVGLADRAHHMPNQLSGGQQQRVAIARALASDPAVLLADEPTGNLDSERSIEIMRLLQDLNRDHGITVVMVTHEPEMASFSKRVVTFKDGVITSDASPIESFGSAEGGHA